MIDVAASSAGRGVSASEVNPGPVLGAAARSGGLEPGAGKALWLIRAGGFNFGTLPCRLAEA